MTDHPDYLRTPNNIFDPDPRSSDFDVIGEHGLRPKSLQDQYDAVADITLHEGVPKEILAKFETAKNLNLFSWFVYRFHSAARSHAYECLERALSTRLKADLIVQEEKNRRVKYEEEARRNPRSAKPPKSIDPERYFPGLRRLLEYAIEAGALKNENFTVWQLKARVRARHRRDVETIEKMKELGLDELAIDAAELEVKDEDRDHDYLGQLLESVPLLRNEYAHGTSALDNRSLSALRVVAEIINQIFPGTASQSAGVRD